MKKVVTVLLVVLLVWGTSAKAQLQQGNWLVGADLANFKLGLDKGSEFNVNLSPKLAFFVRDNLAVGAYINFDLLTSKGGGTNIDYGVGAMGRYYLSAADANVIRHSRFFFEATAGINGTNPASGESTNGLGLSFGPGLAWFLTPNVGLEALVKYSGIVGFGSRTTTSDLLLGFGFQIYLPSGLGKSGRAGKP